MTTMGVKVVLVLALAAVASASIGDNTIEERRVYVEPVLAPPRDSRTHPTDRSRQFPILVLLSQYPSTYVRPEPSGKSLEGSPIYVKTLEDQAKEDGRLNRQKRHSHKHKGLSYGYPVGQSYGGGGGGYIQKQLYITIQPGYGGYSQPHGGGGCNTCNSGGGHGGGGGSSSSSWSQSSSSSGSQSSGYGKK